MPASVISVFRSLSRKDPERGERGLFCAFLCKLEEIIEIDLLYSVIFAILGEQKSYKDRFENLIRKAETHE